MKTISSLVVAALLNIFALASATSITSLQVDDSRFNYTNTGIEEAYIQLDFDGNHLLLILSASELNGGLPSIAVTVPDLGKTDFFGNNIGAELEDLGGLELFPFGNVYRRFEVLHPNVTLAEVEARYVETFTSLGFELSERASNSPNGANLVFTQGDVQLRATLHRNSSGGVSARVSN